MCIERPDDPESRVLGEVPPPRPGRKTHAELIAQAKSAETRAFWEQDERQARESRLGVPGELIAYYTRAATVFEHVLPEHQLRLSSFDQMRDPRENKDWVSYVTGGESARTASSLEEIAEQMNRPPPFDMHEALVSANRARQRRTKILCMTGEPSTRSPDEDYRRCYARPRMWEQYADTHQGACLVFDKAELHAKVMPQLEALGPHWHGAVTYSNAAIQDGLTTGFRLDGKTILIAGGDIDAALAAHFDQHFGLLLFTKMEDYSDERETRYVVLDGRDAPFVHVAYGSSLRAVVLGEGFPEAAIIEARERCAAAGVAIRQVDWRSPYGPVVRMLS